MVETKTSQAGDVTIVEMTGRLLASNALGYAENAINRLIDDGTRKLVLDLAGLDHIDSSGLGMLISCGGRMERAGGRMRISGARPAVARVLQISHANQVLHFDPDLETACRNLADRSAADA
jgi:anti-sigma B factor antagonist